MRVPNLNWPVNLYTDVLSSRVTSDATAAEPAFWTRSADRPVDRDAREYRPREMADELLAV